MKKKVNIGRMFIMISGALLLGYAAAAWSLQSAAPKSISTDQLIKMMQAKDFILINVHIPYAGELPQTDLAIPYNAIEKNKDRLPQDKNARIVVYCVSGHMSRLAAEKLASMGYSRVLDFQDGMRGWQRHGGRVLYRAQ